MRWRPERNLLSHPQLTTGRSAGREWRVNQLRRCGERLRLGLQPQKVRGVLSGLLLVPWTQS